ncbi:MAG: class I SAM-dependent methyltransferase [Candidatus Saccharimonas sp.]
MAEHFRDYLDPSVDTYAHKVLQPERDRTHKLLACYGAKLFAAMGAERDYTGHPDKWYLTTTDGNQVALDIHDPERFFPAIYRYRDVGVFYGLTGDQDGPLWTPDPRLTYIPEGVDSGHREPDSLVQVVEAFSRMTRVPRAIGRRAAQLVAPIRDARAEKRWRASTDRTKAEIAAHYDLSPEVYDTMLDQQFVQYSSGLLAPGRKFESLHDLQEQKVESLIRMLELDSAETLLEVGGGWGGLAVAIAERVPHINITSLTVSHEQYLRAVKRAEDAGVADRVQFREQDYRDLDPSATFDRVVSVEMIEAVDWRDHGTYFDALTRHADSQHGRIVLQAITIRPEQFASQRHNRSFANTAIFPGGVLTPERTIVQQLERRELTLSGRQDLGESYALTLREWIRNLWDRREELDKEWRAEGMTSAQIERFWRGFSFYLAASQAGFRAGTGPNIGVCQLAFKASER